MANLEQIQAMMNELGTATQIVEEVRQYGDNTWAVACGESTIVELRFDGELEKLIFSTDIGKPDENQRLTVYEMLLTYNFLWEDTGGVKMSLDEPGGNVIQVYDLNTADLHFGTLQIVLENFTEKAGIWANVIAEGFKADDAGTTLDPMAGFSPNAIRV